MLESCCGVCTASELLVVTCHTKLSMPAALCTSSRYLNVYMSRFTLSRGSASFGILQAACFAIQNGAVLSRAQVRYFKHNDVADLERILEEQAAKDKRSKCALTLGAFDLLCAMLSLLYCIVLCIAQHLLQIFLRKYYLHDCLPPLLLFRQCGICQSADTAQARPTLFAHRKA